MKITPAADSLTVNTDSEALSKADSLELQRQGILPGIDSSENGTDSTAVRQKPDTAVSETTPPTIIPAETKTSGRKEQRALLRQQKRERKKAKTNN